MDDPATSRGGALADKSDTIQASKLATHERNVRSAAKGGSILAGGKLFAFGNRFIVAFVLARLLGAEQYGLLTLALSATVLMAGIAALGLDYTMVRYVAMLAKKQDEAGLWGTIQIGVGIATCTGILTGAGLYVLAEPIAEQVFQEPRLVPLLQLLSLVLPFMTLSSVLVGTAHGFKKMEYSVIAQNFVQMVLKVLLIGVLALVGLNTFLTAIAFGLSEVAAAITLVFLINKRFPWKRSLMSARRDTREILSFTLPLWLSGSITKFRRNLNTLLLGMLGTVTDVGIFAVVRRINSVGQTSRLSLVTSVRPIIAELSGQKDWAQIGSIYQTTTRWTVMLNLPMVLIMVMFPGAILSIFGKSFAGGATALIILACAELVNAGTGVCGAIIDMTGRTKLKLFNATLMFILSLSLNFLLIPRWGLLGAATAVLISMGAINLLRVVEVWVLFRLQPYNLSLIKPVTAATAAVIVALTVDQWFPAETNLLHTAVHASLLLAVYAGLILLLGLAPEERNVVTHIFQRLGSYIPRKSSGSTV
jgi:O-antigen/teichoic acid export membrane protein